MVRAVKDSFGHDKALQCYAHCLNLLVEQALEDSPSISVIINKVKKIVTYSKQSVKATDVIKEIQKSNGCYDILCGPPTDTLPDDAVEEQYISTSTEGYDYESGDIGHKRHFIQKTLKEHVIVTTPAKKKGSRYTWL
ncbi:unnamed protein product [Macrosiphum euphorbiae]|uniref:Uncharacterized protein n=1 Tax=Macrosiphum euphorbiae TaxID=13131 RepID=A0AAV0Y8W9_9HEMI|nr:unnamed protein product [Macrosiphum euphorbiae]